jgi:hypothetical protein
MVDVYQEIIYVLKFDKQFDKRIHNIECILIL